jgi:hypothetical protein
MNEGFKYCQGADTAERNDPNGPNDPADKLSIEISE